MALRVLFDVNVWVSHFLSLSRGKPATATGQLVRAALEGHCRRGPMQVIASHAMLDTLAGVLERIGLSEFAAQSARDVVEGACEAGALRLAPFMVLGGGVQPMRDEEDGSVLDTALAARAELVVTHNLADFTPGSRADVDARKLRDGVLVLAHPLVPEGMTIASVFEARAWLIDGVQPPAGVLPRGMRDPA